jgi:hypothetical protein
MLYVIPLLATALSVVADEPWERRHSYGRKPFRFIGACPEMTTEFVTYVVDKNPSVPRRFPTIDISYTTLARHCDLDELREERNQAMWKLSVPSNWGVSFHRGQLPSGRLCYYFDWSRMEYFFIEDRDTFDLEEESRIAREQGY